MKKVYLTLVMLALANILLFATKNQQETVSTLSSEGCRHGGIGASGCSIGVDLNVMGDGLGGNCKVTCEAGYYACCGISCTCKKKGPRDLIENPGDTPRN